MMIDTHTHIDLIADDPAEQDRVVAEAVEAGIGMMINIGVDENRLSSCRALAERNQSVFFTAGFHPEVLNIPDEASTDFNRKIPSPDILETSLDHPRCLGIGEIGLDYFHNKENKPEQKKYFARSNAPGNGPAKAGRKRDAISNTGFASSRVAAATGAVGSSTV